MLWGALTSLPSGSYIYVSSIAQSFGFGISACSRCVKASMCRWTAAIRWPALARAASAATASARRVSYSVRLAADKPNASRRGRSDRQVKSSGAEKVKFPSPPATEKVKSETTNAQQPLRKVHGKEVETKGREKRGVPPAPFSLSLQDGADAPKQGGSPLNSYCD
jgi:hypothetical protein